MSDRSTLLLLPPGPCIAVPSLHSLFPEASLAVKEALCFYDENYSCIGHWILEPARKVVLRSRHSGVCRFCNQRKPDVTFRKKAHALPESSGNRSLTTDYECDNCNRLFGEGIENDFAAWSKPQRLLSRVSGKNKIPTLKGTEWRIEPDSAGFVVSQNESDPIAVVHAVDKLITLTVRRDPYTPVGVLKALTKMALSLLPEEELPNFRHALDWIRNLDHLRGLVKIGAFPTLYTFVPANIPSVTSAILLRRKAAARVAYMVFVLTYGNEVYQTTVPSISKDSNIFLPRNQLHFFPHPYELDGTLVPVAQLEHRLIDLTGRDRVENEVIQTTLSYGYARPGRHESDLWPGR